MNFVFGGTRVFDAFINATNMASQIVFLSTVALRKSLNQTRP
jgi:hypothetical protein